MKSTLEKWKKPATTPFLSDADKEQDSETKERYAKWVEDIQEGLPEWSELKVRRSEVRSDELGMR